MCIIFSNTKLRWYDVYFLFQIFFWCCQWNNVLYLQQFLGFPIFVKAVGHTFLSLHVHSYPSSFLSSFKCNDLTYIKQLLKCYTTDKCWWLQHVYWKNIWSQNNSLNDNEAINNRQRYDNTIYTVVFIFLIQYFLNYEEILLWN